MDFTESKKDRGGGELNATLFVSFLAKGTFVIEVQMIETIT